MEILMKILHLLASLVIITRPISLRVWCVLAAQLASGYLIHMQACEWALPVPSIFRAARFRPTTSLLAHPPLMLKSILLLTVLAVGKSGRVRDSGRTMPLFSLLRCRSAPASTPAVEMAL